MTDFNSMAGPQLVEAFNAMVAEATLAKIPGAPFVVKKFADRKTALRRCEALSAMLQPGGCIAAAIASPPSPKKPKKSAEPRQVNKPAGKVEDFRQVRAGTARARVIEGIGRGLTVDRVASHAGVDRKVLMVHLFCLNRDCAIGYSVEGDKITLAFPAGKTAADAIKPTKD